MLHNTTLHRLPDHLHKQGKRAMSILAHFFKYALGGLLHVSDWGRPFLISSTKL
jgi:hypothetical protein